METFFVTKVSCGKKYIILSAALILDEWQAHVKLHYYFWLINIYKLLMND